MTARIATLPGVTLVIRLKARAGEKGLDAAAAPAVAGGAWTLVVRGPRQRVVAPLPRNPIGPGQDLAANDDACACAGADDDAKHDVGARGRAVGRLGDREAVRVVRDPDLAPQPPFEVSPERLADEPHGVRVLDEAGGRRKRSRDADADRRARSGRCSSASTSAATASTVAG